MAPSAVDLLYSNWVRQIKNDDLESICLEFKENLKDECMAFKCFIQINQLVYKAVQKNKICKSKAEVIYQMSDACCTVISSSWSCDAEKFLRCLFHIVNYFVIQGNLNEAKMLCIHIFSLVKVKLTLEKNLDKYPLHDIISVLMNDVRQWNDDKFTFEKRGVTLSDWCNFIFRLIKLCPSCVFISKYISLLITVSQRCSQIRTGSKRDLLCFQLDSLKSIATLESGFHDKDIAFPVLFSFLCIILRNIINQDLIKEEGLNLQCCMESLQKMFHKEEHKDSFLLCNNIIKIFVLQTNSSLLIDECNSLLLKWLSDTAYPICTSVLSFVKLLLKNLRSFEILIISDPAQYKLNSQLKLILNFVRILEKNEGLKNQPSDKIHPTEEYALSVVQCVYSILFITYKYGNLYHEILQDCLDSARVAYSECLQWLLKMEKMKYKKNLDFVTKLFLTGSINLSSTYINAGKFEESLYFAIPACKHLLVLSKNVHEYSDIEHFGHFILKCIGRAYHKIGQTENALLALIAWISCYPQSMLEVFSIWEEVKEREVSENLSANVDTTVYDIITMKSEEISEKWCICNFTKSQQEEMLLKELSVYHNNRFLKGQQVFGVFSALQIITSDPLILSKGLIMAMDIASADANYLIQSAELLDYSKIVMKQLIKKKDKLHDLAISQCELHCLLGNLTYQQFRCELQSARNTSETEIVKLTIQPRKPLCNIELENEINPNDACDVMPAYSSLSLKKMMELLDRLSSAYDYWVQANEKMKGKPDFDLSLTFENMKEAGVQFKLYCAGKKEEQLWKLLYNMATNVDRSDICLFAVSELLDIQDVVAHSEIEYARNLVSEPGVDENLKFTFLIQCAAKCLSDNKISEGLKLIATLKKEIRTGLQIHLHAKFLLILSLYSRTPGIDVVSLNGSSSPSVSLYRALCTLLSIIQNKGWRSFYESCQIHLLLLKVSYELGQFYWEQHQVREARCFIKPELSVAQKLFLPLRTAQLLILLAWIDLSCVNMCDCNIKLDGLEKILDIHSTGSSVTSSVGSPTFVTMKFSGPKFIQHFDDCTCFPCTNLSYQHLVLETVTLRGHFFTINGDKSTAMEYFKAGLSIQEKLCKKNLVLPQFITISLARLLLYYADYLSASNKYKDASIANLKAQDFLKSGGTFGGVLIETCVAEQDLIVNEAEHLNTKKEKQKEINGMKTPVKQAMPDYCLKTPLNYFNKIIITKTPLRKCNGPSTPFARPPPIPFRLEINVDESEKENTPSPVIKVQRRTRAPPQCATDQQRKVKSGAVRKL